MMKTRIMGDAALVCSVQKWDTVNADGSKNPPFMMRQTNYLEKQKGEWKVLHEHTSMAAGWDGTIDE
ncbi:MAG: nuclear transport factor 2 family protein [Flexilinea sp.]|nr:nuclear transport factor 2 family protein [Flexilinea sp.]